MTDFQAEQFENTIWSSTKSTTPNCVIYTGQLTLRQLHHILQVTMGWTHSHLHQFIVPGANESTYYGEPSPEDDYFHKANLIKTWGTYFCTHPLRVKP